MISAEDLFDTAYDIVEKKLRGPKGSASTPAPKQTPAPKPIPAPKSEKGIKGFVKVSDLKPGERIAKSNTDDTRMVRRNGKWLTVIE